MKTIVSIQRVALLALALGTASATATFAQTTPTTTTPPTCSAKGQRHHDPILTADEKAQVKKARDAALAADPSLQTERDSLKQQFETLKGQGKDGATKDQWQALREQRVAFEVKLHAAELAIDPTLAPIFAKVEAARKNWHHSE
jgi:hypothetical protein